MRNVMMGVAALLAGTVLLYCVGCTGEETREPRGQAGELASEAQRLVGLWKGKMTAPEITAEGPNVVVTEDPMGPEEFEVSVEFKEDGRLKMDMFFELSGTWEVVKAEGDNLTINSVMVMKMEMPSSEGETTETTKETEDENEKQEIEFTIVFETNDRITMAPTDEPDQVATLERQR